MARLARVKKTGNGTAYYHLMSRTNDKRFLFSKGRVKTQLVDALKRAAAFSGIKLEAYVAMDNHFHIVCKVVRTEEVIDERELLRRVAALKGDDAAQRLFEHWSELREVGAEAFVEKEQNRLRARMNDISEFIKTFKEVFNVWYKRDNEYTGSIWSGRFTSTLVEGGRYLAICMRYVHLNPVRAGMVRRAEDYAWGWVAGCDELFSGPVPCFAGSVPDGRLMRRVVQMGGGVIFGGVAFVTESVLALRDRFKSRCVRARAVGNLGFATHGWRLAANEEWEDDNVIA